MSSYATTVSDVPAIAAPVEVTREPLGVIGLIIASLINMFLHSSGMQFAISVIGVLIFAGLTAWDTQSIKQMYFAGDGYDMTQKKSIHGALRLYLDFINMFQFLLAFMGSSRNN